MFSLLPASGGSPVPIVGCPLGTNGDGCASQRQASLNNTDGENLIVVKIDHTIDANNSVWYRFQQDTGLQAAFTDPINPVFNSYSPQPQRTFVVGYTHVFGSTLVNQFNPGTSWYSSIFEPNHYSQVLETFPIVLASASDSVPLTTIGGNDNTYPQGRKVTQWQINDNLTWTHGKHSLKLGINTRRLDASNYDLGEGTAPMVTFNDLAQFTYGAAYTASQSFPVSMKERVSTGNLEYYAMDTYKPVARATFTYGIRATWNANVTSGKNLFARTAGSFLDAPHRINQPLNQVVLGNVHDLFPATPLFVYQPRVSFAFRLLPALAVHSGFGAFNDIIPMQIADLTAMNAPNDPTFVGGIGGQAGGIGIAPGVAGSAVDAAVNANNSFQSILRSGGPACAGIQPGAPTCPLAVSLNTFPSGTLKTPYYYQYNFGIERQIGSGGSLRIDFVGTRGLHEPFQVQLNGYQTVCDGCFTPYPYQKPLYQRFGDVNEFRTDANSSYAGLQTAYSQQWRGLTLHANYTFSHCLDEVSNGGLLAFSTQGLMSPLPGELNRQHASCDYDVRHNISAYGLYQIPFHSNHPLLRDMFGEWSISENAILHSGLPFSVLSQPYIANSNGVFQANGASTVQFDAPAYANRVPGMPVYRKNSVEGVTVAGTRQWLNPNAFVSVVDPSMGACVGGDSPANCQFGNSGRNILYGPNLGLVNFSLAKTFNIEEKVKLQIRADATDLFNSPNFGQPNTGIGTSGAGIISSAADSRTIQRGAVLRV